MSYALVTAGGAKRPSRGEGQAASDVLAELGAREREDAALAVAIAAGDPMAFAELYQRYRPLAFAVAQGLLREPAAAEDAVHDAFLRFRRAAQSFQPARGSLHSWLLTIVRNTAIDELRARKLAWRPAVIRAQREIHDHSGGDVAGGTMAKSEAERLHTALRSLPLAQRQALELAFFVGLTHSQIADRTGTPLGTVKGRVRLGLRRLRHDLGDLGPAPAGSAR